MSFINWHNNIFYFTDIVYYPTPLAKPLCNAGAAMCIPMHKDYKLGFVRSPYGEPIFSVPHFLFTTTLHDELKVFRIS